MAAPRAPRPAPSALFFPAAALYAAIALPLSVAGAIHPGASSLPLRGVFAHAHEMLLGYVLAVIAGYQLPHVAPARLWSLFALWCAARVAYLALPQGIVAALLNAAFAVALALHVAPRLFRAAKKWRNQALPVFLSAACAVAVAYALAQRLAGGARLHDLVDGMVLVLTGLMLFMGGRILAPAVAGELYRQGSSLAARVQPRIEATLIVATAIAAAAAIAGLDLLVRLACALAGGLALVRLLRWRLWTCLHRADLLRLAAGYAWLVAGLLGVAATGAGALRVAALHFITVGALGTLTLNVMAATTAVKRRVTALREPVLNIATALVAAGALCRFAAALDAPRATPWLGVAAGCWSAAFLGLALLLLRDRWLRARDGAAHA